MRLRHSFIVEGTTLSVIVFELKLKLKFFWFLYDVNILLLNFVL